MIALDAGAELDGRPTVGLGGVGEEGNVVHLVRPKLERAWAARFAEQVVSRALDNEANIVLPREVDG